MKLKSAMMAAAMLACSYGVQAQTTVKHIQTERGAIASAVWAGDTLYVSGTGPTAVTAADKEKGTPAVWGDMHAQANSVFTKIQKILQDQGLDMKDVVKMTVFMAPDPTTGKIDFAAMNAEFVKFFGTKDQPNKPARSTIQVGLVGAAQIEVEAIAVKSK